MKTVFAVMEKSPLWGVRVSKVFDKHVDAISYRTECIAPDGSVETTYDFDSAYKYWVEEWEVA